MIVKQLGVFSAAAKRLVRRAKRNTNVYSLHEQQSTKFVCCFIIFKPQTLTKKSRYVYSFSNKHTKKKLKLCGVHLQFHFPIPKPAIWRSGRIMLWLMGHCISTWMRRWGSGTLWIHMYFTQIQAQNDIYIYIYRYMHYVWRIVA